MSASHSLSRSAAWTTALRAAGVVMGAAALAVLTGCDSLVWLFLAIKGASLSTVLVRRCGLPQPSRDCAGDRLAVFQAGCIALTVFGLGFLCVETGSVSLSEMQATLRSQAASGDVSLQAGAAAVAGAVLIAAGLAGLACAAWLSWEHAEVAARVTPLTAAWASLVPALAAVLAMQRLFPLLAIWNPTTIIVLTAAALLMTGGACLATLLQSHLRATLAWALSAQVGIWTAALAVACWEAAHPRWAVSTASGLPGGATAFWLCLICDAAAFAGLWLVLAHLSDRNDALRHRDELSGLLAQHPVAGGVVVICLLSLCGVPPLAGFWSRLWLFASMFGPRQASSLTGLYEPHFGFLMLAAVCAAALLVLCGVYLKLVQVVVLEPSLGRIRSRPGVLRLAGAAAPAVLLIAAGVWPSGLLEMTTPDAPPEPHATPHAPRPDDETRTLDARPEVSASLTL